MWRAPKGYDVELWQGVAEVVGLHVDTCALLSKRATDPLPVSEWDGHIIARSAELEAWVQRQVKPRVAPRAYRRRAPTTPDGRG